MMYSTLARANYVISFLLFFKFTKLTFKKALISFDPTLINSLSLSVEIVFTNIGGDRADPVGAFTVSCSVPCLIRSAPNM